MIISDLLVVNELVSFVLCLSKRGDCKYLIQQHLQSQLTFGWFKIAYNDELSISQLNIVSHIQDDEFLIILSSCCIYISEPKWPLFLKVNPPKQGLFQARQRSFGFQVIESPCAANQEAKTWWKLSKLRKLLWKLSWLWLKELTLKIWNKCIPILGEWHTNLWGFFDSNFPFLSLKPNNKFLTLVLSSGKLT